MFFNAGINGQNRVLLKGNRVMKLTAVYHKDGETKIMGEVVKKLNSLYDVCNSARFNIFKIKEEFNRLEMVDVNEIDGKMWALPIDDEPGFFAMLPIYLEDAKQ